MKIFLKDNVYDRTKDRLRFIFDEFDEVVVWVSGGKDSTVLFNLTLEIAREKNRLPLKLAFIDQEAEWENTISYMREMMTNPDVKPYWYQMPIKIFNATSYVNDWLLCWNPEEEEKWMRPKEEYSIVENKYGTDRFVMLFPRISNIDFGENKKVANLAGVRAEESPGRFIGLTASVTYKGITWGKTHKGINNNHFTFYPLYDWSYTDIWKCIHEHSYRYNEIYDFQYRYGIKVQDMRVSNLHHETAVTSLFYMQEVEPHTHNRLINRIGGIDSATKFGFENYFVKELPYMFKNWKGYRDYLLEKLIPETHKKHFKSIFDSHDEEFENLPNYTSVVKSHINSMMANDWTGTKLKNLHKSKSNRMTRHLLREKRKQREEDEI